MDFILGLAFSFLIAFPSFLKKKLSLSGMIAAVIVGSFMYGFGTLLLWILRIAFFLSSTLVSRRSARKIEQKGRTFIQVLANAGLPLIFAFLNFINDNPIFLMTAIILFAGSTSDTWGSEIGTRIKGKTYDVLSFQPVPVGLSGGISIQGTIAAAIGSFFIAMVYVLIQVILHQSSLIYSSLFLDLLLITGLGFLNSMIDSYLGALFQAKYSNTLTGIKDDNQSNEKNQLVAGFAWMTNDLVNLVSHFILSGIILFFLIF
jgi:uncharacterized protein (TIGR00297 family)